MLEHGSAQHPRHEELGGYFLVTCLITTNIRMLLRGILWNSILSSQDFGHIRRLRSQVTAVLGKNISRINRMFKFHEVGKELDV